MAAYVISDATMLDANALQAYRARSTDSVIKYGGKFLIRGGAVECLEGTWTPRIIVLVEFPSMERARDWYRSPEYAHALELRDAALKRNLILVDGVSS
jgi:uncharacterized protein (DUF1330 family)